VAHFFIIKLLSQGFRTSEIVKINSFRKPTPKNYWRTTKASNQNLRTICQTFELY